MPQDMRRNRNRRNSKAMAAKRRRLRRQRRIVLLLVVVIFCLAGLIVVSDGLIKKPQIEDQPQMQQLEGETNTVSRRKDGFYTVLLCGTDDGNGGSDTIMLAAVDTENKEINVLSIPRDTLVNEDWTVKKINSAYNRGGIDAVQEQVEKIVGFPVDFYVAVDLNGFIELVNAIDGIDFEVPINMNYDDPAQNLHIHFSAGQQHLDGEEAMEVVRFRHNNDGSGYPMQDLVLRNVNRDGANGYKDGDLGRIKTQQAFLKAVADKLFSLQSVIKIPEFARIFSENVTSSDNLSLGNMIWFGNQALNIGTENIHFTTLPGEAKTVYGGSYFVLDADACLTLLNESFNPYKADLTTSDLDIKRVG